MRQPGVSRGLPIIQPLIPWSSSHGNPFARPAISNPSKQWGRRPKSIGCWFCLWTGNRLSRLTTCVNGGEEPKNCQQKNDFSRDYLVQDMGPGGPGASLGITMHWFLRGRSGGQGLPPFFLSIGKYSRPVSTDAPFANRPNPQAATKRVPATRNWKVTFEGFFSWQKLK